MNSNKPLRIGLNLVAAVSWFWWLARAPLEACAGTISHERAVGLEDPSGAGRQRSASPLARDARLVVDAVVRAAERNSRLPASSTADRPERLRGDRLTELYFREAAAAAMKIRSDHAISAYLLGLAVALDSSDLLRNHYLTRGIWGAVESAAQRQRRLAVLGSPTMRGRRDLAQHFVVSVALTALAGAQVAEVAGILKELRDSQGSSGFSFADLAADLAGIAFATRLYATPDLLGQLAASFSVRDFMPDCSGLAEGLSQEQFQRRFGSAADPRFASVQSEIQKRIESLPGYRRKRKAGSKEPGYFETTGGQQTPKANKPRG